MAAQSSFKMSSSGDTNQSTDPQLAGSEAFDQKIRRLDRLASLGMISASIAHEIKNGLVAINTFVELLLEKGEDTELSTTVHRELRRIDGLVTQMMRFAGPNRAAATASQVGDVKIHELFDHTFRLLHYPLNSKEIRVEKKFAAGPGVVHGDEMQLQQVFMNLFLNAIEAMEAKGALTVTTSSGPNNKKNQPQMLIEVRDTGSGISGENLAHLFEPFFTTKKNGTGLGLTICERIIREHDGSISATSAAGQGSTFSILLPTAS
jgi:signal transduction histidine kinase